MALKTFVYVGGITNLSDARYCAGMGVDVLGFDIDPNSADHISPETFEQIAEWLSGVNFCGEINFNLEFDPVMLKNYPFSYLEFANPQNLPQLVATQVPLFFKINVDDLSLQDIKEEMLPMLPHVEAFILQGHKPHKEIGDNIKELADHFPIIVGAGLSVENVNELADETDIKGFYLVGGEEIKPGLKDFDELADILEAIEVDEAY